ncbi:Na+/H+ antiporter NhaC family protein [Parashewanella curva]|uniref:Na+/H+ antiporter NhaC family protein n=1 Tax=Parashewanella curva TaxID=2338552 RepID=A0A3L8PST9_9GAMM|nr:Na+/H+ antiporter NhaC family protein [Parashewanella curva]RLV58487.1 Na+/H+ antiporter NhaC family protein [Parashewanella curva]
MTIFSYADSPLSIFPPVLAITLAIISRRVLLSLGAGIIAGGLLICNFSVLDAAKYIGATVTGLFWSNGNINTWNIYILLFLILLGLMTAVMTVSGSAKAFAQWAQKRVNNRRDVKLLTMMLGIVIFIDDYFNSLVVGSVARPLTDRYHISRAKLAYILDSTAAPVCVISPVSSWGAYIIALIGGILTRHGIHNMSYLGAFATMIPMNFYAIFSLLLLFCVCMFGLDVGSMKLHELNAQRGELYDPIKGIPPGSIAELPEEQNGKASGLFFPIGVLVLATVSFMILTGSQQLHSDHLTFSLIRAFEKTNVSLSLVLGSIVGLSVALWFAIRQKMPKHKICLSLMDGFKSMLPALYILVFAWTISGIIGQLNTGKYMASLASSNIHFSLLPAAMFVLAGITSFATGTSWGTFGIMLPIAADMSMGTHVSMMLPMLASVLSGSVFGDHCSPISDTTILSSTGASCHHIDHVTTQLPYALMSATITMFGYLVLGLTESVTWGIATCCVLFIGLVAILRYKASKP